MATIKRPTSVNQTRSSQLFICDLSSQGEGFKNVDSRPSDKAYLKGNEIIVYVHKV